MYVYRIILVFLSFIIISTGTSLAASPSIYLGSAFISIGDEKETVVKKLAPTYELVSAEKGSYFVRSVSGPPFDHAGSVLFINGKVVSASKSWGNFKEIHQADQLIALMETVIKENSGSAYIKVDRDFDPKTNTSSLSFYFRDKTVVLTVIKNTDYGKFVLLTEQIGE